MQPTDAYPTDTHPTGPTPGYPVYPEAPTYTAASVYPGSPVADYPTAQGWAANAQAAAAWIPESLAPDYSASFITAIRRTVRRPLRFRGLASRREFWFSYLAWVLFGVSMLLLATLVRVLVWWLTGSDPVTLLTTIGVTALVAMLVVGIVFMLPACARRLHDGGRSGWWLLLWLVPYGGLAVLVLLVLEPRPWLWRPQWIDGAARPTY